MPMLNLGYTLEKVGRRSRFKMEEPILKDFLGEWAGYATISAKAYAHSMMDSSHISGFS